MFRQQYRRCICPACGIDSVLRRDLPRHDLHLIFTLFTLGLWSVSWLSAAIGAQLRGWTCTRCQKTARDLPAASTEVQPQIHEHCAIT